MRPDFPPPRNPALFVYERTRFRGTPHPSESGRSHAGQKVLAVVVVLIIKVVVVVVEVWPTMRPGSNVLAAVGS